MFGAGSAHADRRVALVIGNAAYQHTRALPNPKNDAEAIAKLLRDNGFTEVTLKSDLDYRAMREAVRLFGDTARAADVALVYYAGHGLEVAGENYLVPIDSKLLRDVDLDYEAVTLGLVLNAVDGARKLKLVVLDACRNNPLGDRMALRTGRTRTVARGLGRLDATGEVLVAYAAKAGTLAQDGAGRHSPYADALLKHMAMPGLDVIRMFGRVKEAVLEATGRSQEPWIYGSPGGDAIALVPAKGVSDAKPAAVPPPSAATLEWARVDKTSVAELETFERRHSASAEAEYARARLKELRKVAVATPPPVAAPPKSVEPAVGVFNPSRAAKSLSVAEERALRPADSFRECDACPEMVVVPAGSFTMGSPAGELHRRADEGPQHRVTIARPFAVGKFEATFAEWDACVAAGGCAHRPTDEGLGRRGQRPVINVSWNDITREYLPWLSRKTGRTYRLLTEAEWEYAARAGTTTAYATGDTIAPGQASFGGNAAANVGSFPANPFGLHDMHGSVWEWVQDCWNANYNGAPPGGSAWTTGKCDWRVNRGGSRHNSQDSLRSASRGDGFGASDRFSFSGFRVARTLVP